MITELTAEQEARFPEFAEKWIRIGLCAEPANRPAAEEGVRLSYRIAGLEPPRQIVWCGSPLSMRLIHDLVRKKTEYGTSVFASVWITTIDSVSACVAGSVAASAILNLGVVVGSVVNPVANPVMASVAASVSAPVTVAFRASVWGSTWASVIPSRWGPVVPSNRDVGKFPVSGQYNANWFAYYDYFRVVCGLTKQTEKMLGVMRVAENANWWFPCKDICWICERPNRLIRDDRGLHCEDGPALSYPDGFSIYAIHGVGVDEQVVMSPQSQDVDKIRKESDAEVKRIRIERFGWPEYLRAVGAVVLDTRHNDVEATKEALMKTPDDHVVLVCACPSTSRVYCLEVPPVIRSCEEAQDWLSGGLSSRVINGA